MFFCCPFQKIIFIIRLGMRREGNVKKKILIAAVGIVLYDGETLIRLKQTRVETPEIKKSRI